MVKRIRKILRTNGNVTSGMRRQVLLTKLDLTSWMGEKRGKIEREKKEERERINSRERLYLLSRFPGD